MRTVSAWIICAMLAVSGCATAGGPRHIATVSIVSAHATLSAIQDTEMLIVCGKPTAPAPPACVADAKHKELSGKLAQAFGYDAQIARTIRSMPAGSPQPAEVTNMLAQIAVLVNQILAGLPQGAPQTTALTESLRGAK
jgi:ABC-type amino acid transport substrate-binding protein